MDDRVENVINVDRTIIERRLSHGRKYGLDHKIYIGDIKENNMKQLDCGVDPNSAEACRAAVIMYDKMLEDFCHKHKYKLNEKQTN
jgi:hypothetical protein